MREACTGTDQEDDGKGGGGMKQAPVAVSELRPQMPNPSVNFGLRCDFGSALIDRSAMIWGLSGPFLGFGLRKGGP